MRRNLIDFFSDTCSRYPDKTAVVDGARQITFAELSRRAQDLGNYLHTSCDETIRQPVAVLLPKSIESVIADLGVVYSGNAYMNLDVKTPAQRIGNILATVQPLCIITDTMHREMVSGGGGTAYLSGRARMGG